MSTPSYLSFARKYRPSKIKDLIGQDALVQTLQNAFRLNRIADAFMLTGTRGVGKTTTARIIAKALNCVGPDGYGSITLNPCGVCEQCISITEDRNLDVLEMDAASKTSVDDIREIIENSKYKPVNSRYKIFIIDEVHMLSKNAFNALLKTLEEPASHLKFIFATTEVRKVPITILSRCQKFDLKRIPLNILTQHLAHICNQENINYELVALNMLAKSAAGSVRDALSLLDQAMVYCNKNITAFAINDMLGNKGKTEQYEFFKLILEANQHALHFITNLYHQGLSLDIFFEDLQNTCHEITVYKITNSISLLDINDFDTIQIKELASKIEIAPLIHIWQILLQGNCELKTNNNTLQIAHMLTTKLILANNLNNADLLINQLTSDSHTAHVNLTSQNHSSQHNDLLDHNINYPKISEKINATLNSLNHSSCAPENAEMEKQYVEEELPSQEPDVLLNNDINIIKNEVKKIFPKALFKGMQK